MALSMTACGGGDEEPPLRGEGSREIAKARLIEKADAICRRQDEELTSRLAKVSLPEEESEQTALVAPYPNSMPGRP